MIAANWLMFRNRWLWKGAAKLVFGVAALLLGIMAIRDPSAFQKDIAALLVLSIAPGIVIFLTAFLCCAISIPTAVRKHFRDMSLAGQTADFTYDETSIVMRDSTTETRLPWTNFHRWSENAKLLIMYRSDFCVHYIPKEQVEAGHVEGVRSALHRASIPLA